MPDLASPASKIECSTEDERGVCREVECGFLYPSCPSGNVCDPSLFRCFAADGRCTHSMDCPRFGDDVFSVGVSSCVNGYCRINPYPIPALNLPRELSNVERSISISSPAAGTAFGKESAATFAWSGPLDAVFALVLDGIPVDLNDLQRRSIWGMTVPRGKVGMGGWADGYSITPDGVWLKPPPVPPVNRTLYFFVESVGQGKLTGYSSFVPFRFGSPWAVPSSACADEGRLGGSCENPNRLQRCIDKQCRVLCLSDRDCEEKLQSGSKCAPPNQRGFRYCL